MKILLTIFNISPRKSLLVVWVMICCMSLTVHAGQENSWKRGLRLFRSYQFDKAATVFRKILQGKHSKKKRIEIYLLLSLSQYNQARFKKARQSFEVVLRLDRRTSLPKGQAPPAVEFYKKLRVVWLKQNPTSRQKKAPIQREPIVVRSNVLPKKRKAWTQRIKSIRKKTPALRPKSSTRKTLALRAKPVRKKANVLPRTRPVAKRRLALQTKTVIRRQLPLAVPITNFWRRYGVSLVLLGVGTLGVGIGSGIAVLSQEHRVRFDALNNDNTASQQSLGQAYDKAQSSWIVSVSLLSVGGVCLLTGTALAIFQASKPIPPKPNAFPQAQTTELHLVSQ